MNFAKALTPKDTEEVKPNLFVQKTASGWRTVNPFAWNGVIRYKQQLRTILSLSSAIRLGVIIFIVWAYLHDTQALRDFQVEVTSDPFAWCQALYDSQTVEDISNLGGLLELNGTSTFSIQNNS